MNHKAQTARFYEELRAVVSRYESEYDLSVAQVLGVIEILKLDIYTEQNRHANEVDDE